MGSDDSGHEDRRESRSAFFALRTAGTVSWAMLGIVGLVSVAFVVLSALSGIVVPLVIAVVLGIVLEPVSEALQRKGCGITLAATLTLLAALAAGVFIVALVLWGFLRQWPQIYRQLALGFSRLVQWIASHDGATEWLVRVRSALEGHATQLGQGVLGAVTSTFYGAAALMMGTFLAGFFLFFALRDAHRFPRWLARTTTLDLAEVQTLVSTSQQSVRGYFKGTAVTALVTAPIFMVPLVILRVPLAIPIFTLYFALSFVPYLGAWITGGFAVLIAFGSGGPTPALVLGVTFVISNGTIQSVVSSWALGSSLRLHPVAVLVATMIGGILAGVLGMVIGAPVLAAAAKSFTAVRRRRTSGDAGRSSE